MTWKRTCQLIASDVRCRVLYDGLPPGLPSALAVFFSAANLALAIHRVQHFFFVHRIPLVNKLLALLNIILFATEIEPEARIGESFMLVNPNGIMIHGHTTIGKNCIFVHQVTTTLGPRIGFDPINDKITIGDHVTLSAGVRVVGNLSIGANCWIGPNKVVTDSIPAGTTLS